VHRKNLDAHKKKQYDVCQQYLERKLLPTAQTHTNEIVLTRNINCFSIMLERKTAESTPERYKINTIGYLGQHFVRILQREKRNDSSDDRQRLFCKYFAEYDFSKIELKEFLQLAQKEISERKNCYQTPKIDKQTDTQSKPSCHRAIFNYFEDMFSQFLKEYSKDCLDPANLSGMLIDQPVCEDFEEDEGEFLIHYLANPADNHLIIDSSPAARKLDILEQKVTNLSIRETEPIKPQSYSDTVQRAPPSSTPKRNNVPIKAVRKQGAKIIAAIGTSLEAIKDICSKNISQFECSFDVLKQTQTANFRVVCEKVPENQDLSNLAFWKTAGLSARRWTSVIQDLSKRTRIRRLITGLDAYNPNSQEEFIKQRIQTMYSNETIKIQKFDFKNQRSSITNFVLEIESTNDSNVTDLITPYCNSRFIKIRPWKGKLPGSEVTKLPTFD
jgi:hypothetical protein